jgi:SNF2 family DNA or RNA helicase
MNSEFREFVTVNNYDVKKHQLDGFEWCYRREKVGGGLLCDEMGLGKTLLMIACMKLNPTKNTLIVVPKSLIHQWRDKVLELLGRTPQVFHGAFAKAFTFNNDFEEQKEIMSKRIFITTYGMLKSNLSKIKWDRIIYDEAHNMRTKKTKVFANAMKIDATIKWMVTGTPVQNSWNDVINLCKLLNFPEGRDMLVKGADKEAQRKYIQSIMLVRTKKEVKINMPTLNVNIVKVAPSTIEERKLLSDVHSRLMCTNVTTKLNYPIMGSICNLPLTYMLRAKQSCSYVKMIEQCVKKAYELERSDGSNSIVPDFVKMSTSKLTKLVDTIEHYGKKVKKLVFYTFQKEMEFIRDQLTMKHYNVGVINGKTNFKKKNDLIYSTEYDVMLVQIKSGSDGLNLQQYQQVYFVSPHWNPAVEQQAIARIYRIGQLASKVDVFYFISTFDEKGTFTIDEYCLEIKRSKQEAIDYLFNYQDNA